MFTRRNLIVASVLTALTLAPGVLRWLVLGPPPGGRVEFVFGWWACDGLVLVGLSLLVGLVWTFTWEKARPVARLLAGLFALGLFACVMGGPALFVNRNLIGADGSRVGLRWNGDKFSVEQTRE
jgi:hypothetical protein